MHEIALLYLGKKTPFVFNNADIGKVVFAKSEPTWLPAATAEWFMKTNPKMFKKTGEKNPVDAIEDAAEIIKAKEKLDEPDIFDALDAVTPTPEIPVEEKIQAEELKCPKCGRVYKDKTWFDKHIAACEG